MFLTTSSFEHTQLMNQTITTTQLYAILTTPNLEEANMSNFVRKHACENSKQASP